MIKKVEVKQLKAGMFVNDFNCGWSEHPFISSQMLIKNDKAIAQIIKHGIHEVYIDTSKGLDVVDAPTKKEVKQKVEADLAKVAKTAPKAKTRVPIQEEIVKAKGIKNEARAVINRLMDNVRSGKGIEMEDAYKVLDKMIDSITRNKDALTSLVKIKKKDEYTYMHSVSVSALMIAFCKSVDMDYEDTQKAGAGALLHDIEPTHKPKF